MSELTRKFAAFLPYNVKTLGYEALALFIEKGNVSLILSISMRDESGLNSRPIKQA